MRPRRLYKYRTLNIHSERMITADEVYVPSPLEFNDPFDCRIPVVPTGSIDDFRKLLYEHFTAKDPNLTTTELRQLIESKLSEGAHEDPTKMKKAIEDAVERQLRATGVYCLSAKNDDILMWSHYADGHQGFCVEFEDDSPNSFLDRANKVTYQEDLPVLNFFDEDWLHSFLTTKSERWSYEEEWRIIKVDGAGIAGIPEGILTGLIFGCKMCDTHINRIISWGTKEKSQYAFIRQK